MSYLGGYSNQTCRLLAVLCGKLSDKKNKGAMRAYPFPEIVSSGHLEVQKLFNPTLDEFLDAQRSFVPNFLYFQGEQLEDEEEIGSLVWGTLDVADPQMLSSLIGPSLPTTVYLEVPNSEEIAQTLHSKGVSYVIFWKNSFSTTAASHFRQALLSVCQSSHGHTWDAFQLAHASFRLYCVRNDHVLPANSKKVNRNSSPHLLGNAPKIDIGPRVKNPCGQEILSDVDPAIKIYVEKVDARFLVCGLPCTLDACLLGSLEDGLGALLNIEIRGSKLHNRISATAPLLEDGPSSLGALTMRCDLTTASSAHVSILVSGDTQIFSDDQLLERCLKNELIEKSQLVHALPTCEESKLPLLEPLHSVSIACGTPVFEVRLKVPNWAVQVLKYLAPELFYRSFVTLGIASIQGIPVGSFEKNDARRLSFFCRRRRKDPCQRDGFLFALPTLPSPVSVKRSRSGLRAEAVNSDITASKQDGFLFTLPILSSPVSGKRSRLSFRTEPNQPMMPVPHPRAHRVLPFSVKNETKKGMHSGSEPKLKPPTRTYEKHNFVPPTPKTQKKSVPNSTQARQSISSDHDIVKNHECNRTPIEVCSEEEFLEDVMRFLILRGHRRLVPRGGVSEFPDAILNSKPLDLYNLYREVVLRGGFHVGNGINWKGQVFSKMRNHTLTKRMNGVTHALKKHYQTYLLEYELAHDDIRGECCLLCHSGSPGNWVNCCVCNEWAHFDCDVRQGRPSFRHYAKVGGLEYVCPLCSSTNSKRKSADTVNGLSHGSVVAQKI